MSKTYYTTNEQHYVLYTGVTNNIQRRMYEHISGTGGTFTKRYTINKLVYIEQHQDINEAIAREKQIKAGSRESKIKLINSLNPSWKNLLSTY